MSVSMMSMNGQFSKEHCELCVRLVTNVLKNVQCLRMTIAKSVQKFAVCVQKNAEKWLLCNKLAIYF